MSTNGTPISSATKLELAGKTVEKGKRVYDQKQDESATSTQKGTRRGSQSNDGESLKESTSITKRNAVEKANIGYTISFSIPFTGTIPKGLSGQTNC